MPPNSNSNLKKKGKKSQKKKGKKKNNGKKDRKKRGKESFKSATTMASILFLFFLFAFGQPLQEACDALHCHHDQVVYI